MNTMDKIGEAKSLMEKALKLLEESQDNLFGIYNRAYESWRDYDEIKSNFEKCEQAVNLLSDSLDSVKRIDGGAVYEYEQF